MYFRFGSRTAIGHFATVATASSTPDSGRSFEMVLASRYPWLFEPRESGMSSDSIRIDPFEQLRCSNPDPAVR